MFEILAIMLNFVNTYFICCIMRSVNISKPYNKKIEFISYVLATFINLVLMQFVAETWIVSMTVIIILGLWTLNYASNLKLKLFSVTLVILIMFFSEIAVRFLVEQPQINTSIPVSETMLHMSLYCRVIEITTITFIICHFNKDKWTNKSLIKWNIHILIAFFAVFFEVCIRSRVLTYREVIFNVILILYIASALIYLYLTEQMIREKERNNLQQQINDYHHQYDMLCTSSHMLLELHYNMKEYLTVIRSMAEEKENEKLISYIDNYISVETREKDLIHTGNYTIDSILSTKFAKARKLGITIDHNIFIPKNMNMDGIDITTILSGMLNCAIDDLRYYSDKTLTFKMNYDTTMLRISMAHANTVSDEERKKYKYIYRDNVIMKSMEKVANSYLGSVWSDLKDNYVYMTVILVVPAGEKLVV